MNQRPYIFGTLGALIGAGAFFGITMDIAVAIVLGAPIGLLVGVIAYRAIPRLMHKNEDRTAQLNGAAPPPPTVEEQPRPAFRMKTKR